MKIIKNIAILFFDIIDKYLHQKRIVRFLKKNLQEINVFLDIGSHKGTYTDLILNNLVVTKKLLLVEMSEYALYSIHQELNQVKQIETELIPLIGSVQDAQRMKRIISIFNPIFWSSY